MSTCFRLRGNRDSPTDIAHWRRQIFSRLLTIVLVLCLVTAVPCIAIAVWERMWPMIGVVLSSAWLVGVWYLTGLARLDVAGYAESDAVPSVLATLNFLFVGSMITVSCGTLLTRLAQSQDEPHLFAASLEEGKDALHAMNAELRLTGAALAQLNGKVLITRAVDATDGEYQPQPIIFANDAFLLRTGYTREELLGQSLTAFIGQRATGRR